MKIRCVKAECPKCKVAGSIQLFLNKDNQVKYARTRHYSHLDKDSKKPQFTYCKIENLDLLKTLLLQQNFSIDIGQSGQLKSTKHIDLNLLNLSFNLYYMAGGEGFEPSTPNLGGWCSIQSQPRRTQNQPLRSKRYPY